MSVRAVISMLKGADQCKAWGEDGGRDVRQRAVIRWLKEEVSV